LTALNSKKMVGSIFFDLAKAFDSVNMNKSISQSINLKWQAVESGRDITEKTRRFSPQA
jgi:hypothetical protein